MAATSGDTDAFRRAITGAYAALLKWPDADAGRQVDDLTWAAGMFASQGKFDEALEAATKAEALAKQLGTDDSRLKLARLVRAKALKAHNATEELKAYADLDLSARYSASTGMVPRWAPEGFKPTVDIEIATETRKDKEK